MIQTVTDNPTLASSTSSSSSWPVLPATAAACSRRSISSPSTLKSQHSRADSPTAILLLHRGWLMCLPLQLRPLNHSNTNNSLSSTNNSNRNTNNNHSNTSNHRNTSSNHTNSNPRWLHICRLFRICLRHHTCLNLTTPNQQNATLFAAATTAPPPIMGIIYPYQKRSGKWLSLLT